MVSTLTGLARRASALLLVLLGAALVRCRLIAEVFLEGDVYPFDPDSHYHLWRIEEAVAAGGAPPAFDPFANAPEGAAVIWPDGFDGFLALLVRLFFGDDASRFEVQLTSMAAVPILGALAVVPAYLLGRRLFGTAQGLAAALLAAVLPAHVDYSLLGRVDHHVLEIGLPPLALWALFAAASGGRVRVVGAVAGAGLALAALVYTVPSALLHAAIVWVAGVAVALVAATREGTVAARNRLLGQAAAFGVAAAASLPDALSRGGFAFFAPSALPATLLGAGAVVAAALSMAARYGPRLLVAASLLAGGAAMATLFLAVPGAAGFLGREGGHGLVTEGQPLVAQWDEAVTHFSAAVAAIPVVLVWLARRCRSPETAGLAVAGLLGFLLASLQVRYVVAAAPMAAVSLAAAAVALWREGRAFRRALLIATALLALAPCVRRLATITVGLQARGAVLEAARWIARHTPPAGERRSGARPAYSILSLWDMGGEIAYIARRPVVAVAYFFGDYARAFEEATAMLFGDGEPGPLLTRRRVRYLALPALDPWVEAAHRALRGDGPARVPTLYARLFDHDGSVLVRREGNRPVLLPALDEMRLRHESPFTTKRHGRQVPRIKLFERVAGAQIDGSCAGGVVRARTLVRSDQGRVFEFVGAAPCRAGRFTLRVPYPGRVEVRRGGGLAAHVSVGEEDVTQGRTVSVP